MMTGAQSLTMEMHYITDLWLIRASGEEYPKMGYQRPPETMTQKHASYLTW